MGESVKRYQIIVVRQIMESDPAEQNVKQAPEGNLFDLDQDMFKYAQQPNAEINQNYLSHPEYQNPLNEWEAFRDSLPPSSQNPSEPEQQHHDEGDWVYGSEEEAPTQNDIPAALHKQDGRDLDQKEALVRKEILEKGYAPQDFDYYLQKFKGEGGDLSKWGLKELRGAILEFQDYQFAQMLQQEEKEQFATPAAKGKRVAAVEEQKAPAIQPPLTKGGHPVIMEHKVPEIMPFLKPYEHGPFLQVNQLKPSILNKHSRSITFQVVNPKIVEQTGFLFIKTSMLMVTIQTFPVKWDCLRTENDIYQLRRLLQLQFPHLLVPPLPAKQETKFTQRSMAKRCIKFQRFFSALVRNEQFCTYQLLVEFLMLKHKDMKTFTDKMKQEETTLAKARVLGKPDIQELSSMYDKISSKLQSEAVAFDLPQFIERYESLCKAVIEDGQHIRDKSNQLHATYLKYQEILMRISQFHSEEGGSIDQLESFAHLSKVFGTDAFIIEQQGESFFKAMRHLKYNISYTPALREMQLKAEYAKQRFLKAEKIFLQKREKVVGQLGTQNQQQVSQAVIDSLLPTETKELEKTTQFMNFFTNQVFNEVQRMQFQMELPGMLTNFTQLTKEYTMGLNQKNMQWSGLLNTMSKQEAQPQMNAAQRAPNNIMRK